MKIPCLLLTLLAAMSVGCGYDDPRLDPREQPDFVDTSDPRVLLGQRKSDMEKSQQQAKEGKQQAK